MNPATSDGEVYGKDEFLQRLRADGVVASLDAELVPFSGGVSSDIFHVRDGEKNFVVKRALGKLRVKDEWLADTNRNRFERNYFEFVSAFLPTAVPRVLSNEKIDGYFTMEYLAGDFRNWKQMLFDDDIKLEDARSAATILATIHRHSFQKLEIAPRFGSNENFMQLRVDPYLLLTGRKYPDLEAAFQSEAQRLISTRECLVHGDFSPKNIMISSQRMVVVDAEVAWYGDPSFDVAFLMNHLLLKGLHIPGKSLELGAMCSTFWETYAEGVRGYISREEIAHRVARLLPMLLLARVDGKSPAEYLSNPAEIETVRSFAKHQIQHHPTELNALLRSWFETTCGGQKGS